MAVSLLFTSLVSKLGDLNLVAVESIRRKATLTGKRLTGGGVLSNSKCSRPGVTAADSLRGAEQAAQKRFQPEPKTAVNEELLAQERDQA